MPEDEEDDECGIVFLTAAEICMIENNPSIHPSQYLKAMYISKGCYFVDIANYRFLGEVK